MNRINREITIDEEYSKLVRPLNEAEFEALKESIQKNGLLVPIIVNKEGKILDGHNRFRIAEELGIKPKVIEQSFDDPNMEKLFVIESNLKRRQLTDAEKVELGLALEPIYREINRKRQLSHLKQGDQAPETPPEGPSAADDANGENATEAPTHTDAQAAKAVGLSQSKYQKGKKVLTEGSEEVKKAYKESKISTNEAYHKTMGHDTTPKPHAREFSLTLPAVMFDSVIRTISDARENTNCEVVCRHDGSNVLALDIVTLSTATSE
jgi:ParB-like chromosome segregation protein Spo0J